MIKKVDAPFQQIKALVRKRIQTGDWKIGERIPSELDLAAELGVARMTVNRALRELTDEGALQRILGVGTFVAEEKPQSNLLMIAHVRDEIHARGHQYRCHVISQARGLASSEVAAAFGLPVNAPVFHVVCVHEENGRPIQLEERYVNPAAAPNFIDQDFQAEPPSEYLYNNVSHYELEIEHVVDATMPTAEQAKLLDMRADEPCLTLTRRTWTNGLPVTFVRFVHPGNRYRLGSRFKPGATRHQI
ncbi:histidine utilization repressor [Paraburkholderia silviterrae]|uniref:Histidine utilization repressor n=1 Tax=Paraburkholderia silviterrae TaxID=2528715 RepID=A0A4R5M3F2_9BURK|nr:histidine utilization repressor [Paraburkholderia silviterrae]TDG19688.1 histidine utilization repressor [Paraburkholderia silviterrae]